MPDILEDARKLQQDRKAEAVRDYAAIVRRSAADTSEPGDAELLLQRVKDLGRTDQEVTRDVAALQDYFQAKRAADECLPSEVWKEINAALEVRTAAEAEFERARVARDIAVRNHNLSLTGQLRLEMLSRRVHETQTIIAHLLK